MDTYSSGTPARLHFSTTTMVTSQILLIDEALAVSQALGELRRSCDRVHWLEKDLVLVDGPTAEILEHYEST